MFLLGLNGKLALESGNPASPLLQITTPHVPIQLALDLPNDAEPEPEEEPKKD
jgi:hypothetical protein